MKHELCTCAETIRLHEMLYPQPCQFSRNRDVSRNDRGDAKGRLESRST